MLTHVVLFILRDPTTVPHALATLRSLEGQVPSLQSIEVGVDTLPGARSAHLALITRFQDAAALEAYRVHPVHQGVLQVMKGLVERSIKVDFVS